MSPFYREAMRLHAGLAVMTPEAMNDEVYQRLEQELEQLLRPPRADLSRMTCLMLYDLILHISYTYDVPASGAPPRRARAAAVAAGRQRLIAGSVTCTPHPDERSDFIDFFATSRDLDPVSQAA